MTEDTMISSVQFSRSAVSNSLRPHESQHTRPPCPSPTHGVHSTHVHQVGDSIQPSHSLLSPSPPALNASQHQSLFQWVNSSHEVAKVLELKLHLCLVEINSLSLKFRKESNPFYQLSLRNYYDAYDDTNFLLGALYQKFPSNNEVR